MRIVLSSLVSPFLIWTKMFLLIFQQFSQGPAYQCQVKTNPPKNNVDKWPNLGGVSRVDADVGLLLACDAPEVLDPLEIKHSQGGGR